MVRLLPLLLLALWSACDDLDATSEPVDGGAGPLDATRPPDRADAAPTPPGCTGEFCSPREEERDGEHDAGTEAPDAGAPLDVPVDASTWEPIPPTYSATGQTCLGLRDFNLACELERCGPAHYRYTNLSVNPVDVTCPGGEYACPEPLPDPQDPFYFNSRGDRGYEIFASWENPAVMLTLSFTVDIEFARDAAEAQRTISHARLTMDLGWEKAFWSDAEHKNTIPGTASVEVLDFVDRRIHVRVRDTAHQFNGGQIPGTAICGIEGACFGNGCWWADDSYGGSGAGPTAEVELAFALPPPTKVEWVLSP